MLHPAHDKFEYDIVKLHEFFVTWFRGDCERNEEYFAQRFTARFAADFKYVLPDGQTLNLETLTGVLRDSYACSTDFRIKIQSVETCSAGGDLAIVTYRELQKGEPNSPAKDARISSAVMKLEPQAPNGVHWLHLHETYLSAEAVAELSFEF